MERKQNGGNLIGGSGDAEDEGGGEVGAGDLGGYVVTVGRGRRHGRTVELKARRGEADPAKAMTARESCR